MSFRFYIPVLLGTSLCVVSSAYEQGVFPARIEVSGAVSPLPQPYDLEHGHWDVQGGSLWVGQDGIGALTIKNGGAVSAQDSHIGAGEGSVGTVSVLGGFGYGARSEWNAGILFLGGGYDAESFGGSGTLTINNSGWVSSYESYIGSGQNSVGIVTVGGIFNGDIRSEWQARSVFIGGALDRKFAGGSGTLTITDGGLVHTEDSYVGAGEGSVGNVTVSGGVSNSSFGRRIEFQFRAFHMANKPTVYWGSVKQWGLLWR